MRMSEQCNEIFKAMALAQGDMTPAIKDSTNPHFRSTYSNINSIWSAIRAPLSKNGISVFQDVISTQSGVSVTTLLGHSSGQWMEFGPLEIPLAKRDAHGVGSGTSYAKRYALCAIIGVSSAEEDDDGNSATAFTNGASKATPAPSTIAIISSGQANLLAEVLKKCPEGYVKYVKEYLKSQNIESINNLPVSLFERLWNDASIQSRTNEGKSPE